MRSLSDFVDKSLPQLLIANGIALANGQPPQFSLPPIVASSQADVTVHWTPDETFLLGPHPAAPDRVTVAAGFSGHGFKFAPVVGEILADLAQDGRTRHDIGMFAPTRFTTR